MEKVTSKYAKLFPLSAEDFVDEVCRLFGNEFRIKKELPYQEKWNIIFHIEGIYVVVDAIIPSSLMK